MQLAPLSNTSAFIGRKTCTGNAFVRNVRKIVTGSASSEMFYKTKHGTVTAIDTAAIGRDMERVYDGSKFNTMLNLPPTVL